MEVLNNQPPMGTDRHALGQLKVHSYFPTIQGEGIFAGQAAFFIRLMGCNLQCPGCDTEYTTDAPLLLYPRAVVELLETAGRHYGDLVVITGGEPFRQNITPAVLELVEHGYHVQIETNGTLYLENFPKSEEVTIVCSPKTARINPVLAARVDAFKYVIQAGHVADDGLPTDALYNLAGIGRDPVRTGRIARRVARPPDEWEGPVYVQPMDEKDDVKNLNNLREAARTVMNGSPRDELLYVLGTQMHKDIGLP
jgi:organic radical activating enzyme